MMRKFDYSFLDDGLLPAGLVNLTSNIYALRTASDTRKSENEKVFTELVKIAKVQSVKSSNAIEGIITSDRRITEIVNNSSAPLNHDEAEIAGYRDALDRIHNNYEHISFSQKDILLLHEMMLTPASDPNAGHYKQTDNVIVEIDASGNRRVRFRPVQASETEAAMEQLELAYLEACANYNINRLLLIPCVILDFLCIHPFSDGNGRMSRLLSLLLLYQNGFDVGKYISYEEQINRYKDLYYDALKRSSEGWGSNQNDYFPFVDNFLSMLFMCYKELDRRFAVVNGRKANKTERIEAAVCDSLKPLSKADICALYPDISPTTVEAVLGRMVREGKIIKIGASKNTRYIKVQ